MGRKDPRVDAYIAAAAPFARPILKHLRKLVHEGCPEVEEDLKWSHVAFMYKGRDKAWGQFGRITSLDDLPSDRFIIALVKKAVALHDAGVIRRGSLGR